MFKKNDLFYATINILIPASISCMLVAMLGMTMAAAIVIGVAVGAAATMFPILGLGIAGMFFPHATVTRWEIFPIGVTAVWVTCKATGRSFPDQT